MGTLITKWFKHRDESLKEANRKNYKIYVTKKRNLAGNPKQAIWWRLGHLLKKIKYLTR